MSAATPAVLTVAIPTYDRPGPLRRTLEHLLPQLTTECHLVLSDNHSPTPAESVLRELTGGEVPAGVTLVRHPVNVGSMSNILRCYERCATEWLWVLGDDDTPRPGAVAAILDWVKRYPDAVAVNFHSHDGPRPDGVTADGLEGLADSPAGVTRLTLISNTVWRAPALAPYLRFGHTYAYSMWPHMAVLLAALTDRGGRVALSGTELIEWNGVSEWSRIAASLGMPVLWDMPMPQRARRKWVAKMRPLGGRLSSTIPLLLARVGHDLDAATARYLFGQIWHRNYQLGASWRDRVTRLVGAVMLAAPGWSLAAYRRYRRARGHEFATGRVDEYRRA